MPVAVSSKLVPYHVSMLLDASETMVPDGHRLVTVGWKLTERQKEKNPNAKARPTVCVSVQQIVIDCQPVVLKTAVQDCVNGLQDSIVSETINQEIAANTAINLIDIRINPESVTEDGIASWAANKAISGRLSKDTIGVWFDCVLAAGLTERLKLIPAMTADMLPKVVMEHRKKLQELASPKAMMPEKLVRQLQKALDCCEGTDKVKSTLSAKLAGFLKTPDEEMLLALT